MSRIFVILLFSSNLWANTKVTIELPASLDVPSSAEVPTIPASTPPAPQEATVTGQVFDMNAEQAKLMKGKYEYVSRSKPDPFLPSFKRFSPNFAVKSSKEIQILSPLQTELSDLSIRGIWQNEDQSWRALIVTKDGQGVVAKAHDAIGPMGKISNIDETGLQVRQFKFKDDGTREYEDLVLPFMRMEQNKNTAVPTGKPQGASQ